MARLPAEFGQPSREAPEAGGGAGEAGANESILVGSECIYFPDFANRSVSALIHSVHALLNSRCTAFCYCSLLTVCLHLSVCFMCVSLARPPPSFFFSFFSFLLPFFYFFLFSWFVLLSFLFRFLQFNGKYFHQSFLIDAVFVSFFLIIIFIYIFFPYLSLFPHYI